MGVRRRRSRRRGAGRGGGKEDEEEKEEDEEESVMELVCMLLLFDCRQNWTCFSELRKCVLCLSLKTMLLLHFLIITCAYINLDHVVLINCVISFRPSGQNHSKRKLIFLFNICKNLIPCRLWQRVNKRRKWEEMQNAKLSFAVRPHHSFYIYIYKW